MLRLLPDIDDLDGMRRILVAGRMACSPTYYIHPGDLDWWLFYLDQDWRDRIHILENDLDGRLLGWVLFSPRFNAFDVFVDPDPVCQAQRLELFTWAAEQMAGRIQASGRLVVRTMWISEHDVQLIAHLESRGFKRDEYHMIYLEQSLTGPISQPQLPQNYRLRHVAGEHEAELRARASHATFQSPKPFAQYLAGYRRFMRSPAYALDRDLVVEAPDGQFAAFCIFWLDDVNRVGYFEPVGVHPDFRRQGLGTALIQEGLRQMKERGMGVASVCVESDNPSAQKFYESVGFGQVHRIFTYQKENCGTLVA